MHGEIIDFNDNAFTWIITRNDEIINVGKSFQGLTEYDIKEAQGKKIQELWKILRLNPAFDYGNDNHGSEYFLFTKSHLIKEVTINFEETEFGQAIYFIKEKYDFNFKKKFQVIEQMICENIVGVGIFKVPEIILVRANQKFLDSFDEPYNRAENSIGRFLGDIVTPWKGSTFESIWDELLKSQRSLRIDEYTYDGLKKGERYFNSNLTPVFENGELKYYVEIISDVTENVLNRKRIEEQNKIIKEQNQKLEAIIENMSDRVFLVYENGDFLRLNKAAREFIPDDIEDEFDKWFKHAKYYDRNGKEIKKADMPIPRIIRGEMVKNYNVTMGDEENQKHMMVNGTPVIGEGGKFQFGIICAMDVTKHVNYQREKLRQMDNFDKIVSNIDIPILRISYPDYVILGYNNKLYENLKSIHGDMRVNFHNLKVGISLLELMDDLENHCIFKSIKEVVKTKSIVYLDRLETIQNGKRKVSKFILQPLFDTNEKIIEIIITSYDVTNIIEEKEGLEKLLKMQEEFFSFISHEFKTPLSVISAAIQTMDFLCASELSDRERNYLNKIKRSTLQQMRLVNNLLDITRADSGYLKLHKKNRNIVQMTELIINSVEPFADEKGVKIDFNADEDNITTLIDDEKYERILLNLLSNSIKFTPEGKNIYVDLFREDEKVFIKVRDEGIGIPKKKQQAIFDRFEQAENGYIRNSNGTGIGLCLVKLLVEAMDGEISFESEEGEGTCFRIMFPIKKSGEDETLLYNLMDNRLVETRNIEFSNIYLD